jgi:hypothetical protein
MRRRSASSDGNQTTAISVLKTSESNNKLSGRNVAEMGMAIALTRVRLQPSGPEVRSTRETSKEVP